MERSSYILGGMELLTQHAETQKSNIYWTLIYIKKGVGMYILDSDLRALNEGDIIILPPKVSYSFCQAELGDEYNTSVDAAILRFDDAWLTTLLSVFKTLNQIILRIREIDDPYFVVGPKWMKLSTVLDGLFFGNSAKEASLMIELLELISTRKDMIRILEASPYEIMSLTRRRKK